MKNTFKTLIILAALVLLPGSCSYLDPLSNGAYTDENFDNYPELLRGYIDKIYNDYRPKSFYTVNYTGLSAMSEECLYASETNIRRLFIEGNCSMTDSPFENLWDNNYTAINYANRFLKDNKGYETQYMLNHQADQALRSSLQGDAYGLRAWLLFGLLKTYAGEGTDGTMLGVPVRTEATDFETIDYSEIYRPTIDECIAQILDDCDSAYVYLHESNRDYPDDESQEIIVTGSARYTTLDKVTIDALRAQVYLFWASPAWNPGVSQTDPVIVERYRKSAEYSASVMKFKLERESTLTGGFDPAKKVDWANPNSQEIIWSSHPSSAATNWETALYPVGFGGSADIVPAQALVDRFADANGYPITDPRSIYDPSKPYENRDPRFYSVIHYNGSQVVRNTDASDIMYTFEIAEGGKDAPGQTGTSITGYYIKKFLYNGWNPYDSEIQKATRPLMFFRWSEMCLMFAEAASRVTSPTDETTFGYSAKQALNYLRSRTTTYDMPGLGATSDPYLDECAAEGGSKFLDLVKNEWYVETCFEGKSFYNCRRWAASVDEINVPIEKVVISADGTYKYENVTTINYPSLWVPLPYLDVRRCPNLLQNKGWESWK